MTSMTMKTFVGIGIAAFVFLLGNAILFGFVNLIEGFSIAVFKTIYFIFMMLILGIIYLMNTENLTSKTEHIMIIISIIAISAATSTLAGSLKMGNDINTASLNDPVMQQNVYYSQYAQSLQSRAESLKENNKLLESEIKKLNQTINNRTPIMVETIVTIPGEIIYVEERVSRREREDEDDD